MTPPRACRLVMAGSGPRGPRMFLEAEDGSVMEIGQMIQAYRIDHSVGDLTRLELECIITPPGSGAGVSLVTMPDEGSYPPPPPPPPAPKRRVPKRIKGMP